tara:strand:- start:178 stop:504 length:327 start_codon:yes stop_codon:yes gene_type:complete
MSDLFDDFNKIFKKDLVPIFVKYLKDPNNKIVANLSDFINDPQTLITNIFEKFSKYKGNDNDQQNNSDIENVTDIYDAVDDEYDELFKRLIFIEENMIQIKNILKDKN